MDELSDSGIKPGITVLYPRTGTTGIVKRLDKQNGFVFAELEDTGLLFRVDQLVTVSTGKKSHHIKTREEELIEIENERAGRNEEIYTNALNSQDDACHGGG